MQSLRTCRDGLHAVQHTRYNIPQRVLIGLRGLSGPAGLRRLRLTAGARATVLPLKLAVADGATTRQHERRWLQILEIEFTD
jgi:hypothetical protein